VTVKPFITIDHFLVSKDLAVKDRRVLGYAGSDHLPVLVSVGRSNEVDK
jgi:endonuclease/exonuclease/phosphatase family metal-dependent hydrolase